MELLVLLVVGALALKSAAQPGAVQTSALYRPTTADDGTILDPLAAKLGLGLSKGGGEVKPAPGITARRVPKFTDLGQVAQVNSGGDAGDTIARVGESRLLASVPGGGVIQGVVDAILGTGNAARLSPQQYAYVKAAEISYNANPTPQGANEVGQRLADVEGVQGTKIVTVNGEDVMVGGTGRGGPGWSALEDAGALEDRRSTGRFEVLQ